MEIANLRNEYRLAELTKKTLLSDPFLQFEKWMEEAVKAELREPTAMVLSTADKAGAPSARTVLLKIYDREGFVFFTNYQSRKSREIGENPQVALLFPWLDLERQVIVMGTAERVSTAESMKYFASRPRGSQLGAWSSAQSSAISSRKLLQMQFEKMKEKFMHGEIPLPDFWGGYRVTPHRFEFWQGRPNRLHDRFEFVREAGGEWKIDRLAP
ncbi:MAG: pyridoxamine 5'-phosphate oxidase [Saprospirales bacterium]|nr:pyridoxamine 5'-phosphate oxidase [Saprospirales bacterium]